MRTRRKGTDAAMMVKAGSATPKIASMAADTGQCISQRRGRNRKMGVSRTTGRGPESEVIEVITFDVGSHRSAMSKVRIKRTLYAAF
jgi:hypothetical protein